MKLLINVLFCCNTHYAMPLAVCLTSLFENNKNNTINAYILHSNVNKEQKEIFLQLAQKYNQKIYIIHVAEFYFNNVPTLRWSKEAYYRLLINEYIPKDINRILYLDCDTIIQKPLNDLYNVDLDTAYIAALEEKNHQHFRTQLGLSTVGKYFQSGVVLMDLTKCRTVLNYTTALQTIDNLGEKLCAVDQDIINILFDGKIKELDRKFNDSEITSFENNQLKRIFNIQNNTRLKETYILHYASGKPWNNLYSGSCENVWYSYLILSPYATMYNKKFNTFFYRILRSGIVKIIFYNYIHLTPKINAFFIYVLPQKVYDKMRTFYRNNIK